MNRFKKEKVYLDDNVTQTKCGKNCLKVYSNKGVPGSPNIFD